MQNSTTEMGTEIAKKSNTALEWCGYIITTLLVSGEHKSSIRIIQTKLFTSHHTMIRTSPCLHNAEIRASTNFRSN